MAERPPIYVGYLPLPTGQRAFVVGLIALILLTGLAVTLLLATQQQPNGHAVWHDASLQTFTGTLVMAPYPMLITTDQDGQTQASLIVSEFKYGAKERLADLDQKRIELRGTRLERDGRNIIEIAQDPASIRETQGPITPWAQPSNPLGNMNQASQVSQVTLVGELIDPKCYLGAMKPGGGKVHRACAQLCLLGGIPPMFITRQADGSETYYLVTSTDGQAVTGKLLDAVIDHVGIPVQITGELIHHDHHWQELRIAPTAMTLID